jgi:polyhydroxybutyrate depolymerase
MSPKIYLLVAAAIAIAACGSSTPGATASATSSLASSGTVQHKSLNFGGRVRTYRLFRSGSVPAGHLVPLVVLLHGCSASGGSGDEMAANTNFDNEAIKIGAIAAYPDAVACWNDGSGRGPSTTVDDIGFISQLIKTLSKDQPIDPKRVFLAGFSIGAVMASRVACELSNQVVAIAAVGGRLLRDDPACHPSQPVSILAMAGTNDMNFPYEGDGPINADSAMEFVHQWALLDQCDPASTLGDTGITTTLSWHSCKNGRIVRLDTVKGGQHTWFGSGNYSVTGEPNANSVIGSFFSGLTASA